LVAKLLLIEYFTGMPIRIMHVVDNLGKGGLQNGLVNLIHGLDPRRFEHVVYAIRGLGPNADRLPKDRVTIICQGKRETDSRFQLPVLARAIRKGGPDIVHSRNWGAVEAGIAARLVGSCSVVHSEHGLESDAGVKEPRRKNWFRRMAYESAHQVVSVSHQLKELHAGRTGFNPDRIAVIHNGVDGQRFFPDPAARARVRQELGLSEDEFCIGCVGNLLPVKDHMTVLRAVERLGGSDGPWRLLIAGEGPERPTLERFLIEHPECRARVSLMGTSDRVAELLNAMDVYVLSSAAEGICNSLLEAMSTGLPVIATNTGGNPEVVVDGESGWLFPVGDWRGLLDRLALLKNRPDMRAKLGWQAIGRVRAEFSMESMIRQYALVYERLGRRAASAPAGIAARA
jgi:sugar transferase (PEP-CTERM/EpsH1 system associated)